MFGWVLFRADAWSQAVVFWKAMVGLGTALPGRSEVWLWFGRDIQLAMAAGMLLSLPVVPWLARRFGAAAGADQAEAGAAGTPGWVFAVRTAVVFALLLACVPFLVADTYNPFIYFRF